MKQSSEEVVCWIMFTGLVVAVAVLCVCGCTNDQARKDLSTLRIEYGQGDWGADNAKGSRLIDGDSSYVGLSIAPLAHLEPPQRVLVENMPQPYREQPSPVEREGDGPGVVDPGGSAVGPGGSSAAPLPTAPLTANPSLEKGNWILVPPAWRICPPEPEPTLLDRTKQAVPYSLAALLAYLLGIVWPNAPRRLLGRVWGWLGRLLAAITPDKPRPKRKP